MPNENDWHLLDDGSWNGVRKSIRGTADDEGSVQVKYEAVHTDQIIEENKNAAPLDKRSELWHVGHIPASVGLKWLVEEGVDLWNPHHSAEIKKKLMDSDYRYLVPGQARIML